MDFNRLASFLDITDAYGNSVRRWLLAAAVALVVGLLLWLVLHVLSRRMKVKSEQSGRPWVEGVSRLLARTRAWFVFVIALYCGSLVVLLPRNAAAVAMSAAVIALLVQAALWGDALLAFALARDAQKRLATDAASVTLIATLGFIGRLAMWTLVVLLALDNVGVNITALIAGLGIGGVAVALAAQNILGDLFASLSIVFDKPFVLGDRIAVGTDTGDVEHIGMKSTRVRTPEGDQLIFSNADLLKSRIRNCKRTSEKRVAFTLAAALDADPRLVAEIPTLIRQAIEGREKVRFDRSHFKEIGQSGLVFETVYFVTSPDANVQMDLQQAINLAILRSLAARGVSLAPPAQSVYVHHAARRPEAEAVDGVVQSR
jgi:small-conductance mechanosensitive channel